MPRPIAPAGRRPSRGALARCGLGSAGLALILTGCTAGAPVAAPTVTVTTTVTASPAPQRDIPDSELYSALYSAQVPAMCNHQAGTLSEGILPGLAPDQGSEGLAYAQNGGGPNFRQVTDVGNLSTGERVVATVVICDAGGVAWPDYLVAWRHVGDGKIALLTATQVATSFQPNSSVTSVQFADGAFEVAWTGPAENAAAADQSLYSTADFTFTSDGRVTESKLTSTTDPAPGD